MMIDTLKKNIKKNKNSIFRESIWFKFWKIFLIFFFPMFTIVIHNLIPLIIPHFQNYNISGALVSQSIGYSQPIIFFAITIIVMISIQILIISKKKYNDKNKYNFKDITNTGFITLNSAIFAIGIIFVITMLLFSKVTIGNSTILNKEIISKFIEEYSSTMIFNLFIIGASIYFLFMITEFKFKIFWIFILEIFFSSISILISIIFIKYTNISPPISLSLSTFISNSLKLILILIIFFKNIADWKIFQISFDKKIFIEIWNSIFPLSFYMLVYSLTMVIQMILITSFSTPSNEYLFTRNGEYLIIISRVIVYSIINLMITISRSMGRALILHFDKPSLNLIKSENQFKISIKYSLIITGIFLLIGIIISTFITNFVDGIFVSQTWSHEIIPKEIADLIPFEHNPNINYIDVIKKFVLDGFILSIVSQILLGLSINIRISMFFNYKRELKIFWIILFVFFISLGLGNYFFGVVFQNELPGLIGFIIAQIINSFLSFVIAIIGTFYTKITLINEILDKKNKEKIKPIYKYNSLKSYFIDIKTKRRECLT